MLSGPEQAGEELVGFRIDKALTASLLDGVDELLVNVGENGNNATGTYVFQISPGYASNYNDRVAGTGWGDAIAGMDGNDMIAGGGGMVVLEDRDRALARGARIWAEVTGFAATSAGHDMVAPSGEGGERAMRLALSQLPDGRRVSYINAHGTSTPVGDVGEVMAVRRAFGEDHPPISSTKSMTGHSQGATGALQATQAGNQILALQSQQLSDLVALLASNGRASALTEAERTAAAEQGREQRRRFLTPGSGYQPGNAQMFNSGK